MAKADVEIYTTMFCPFCDAAKRLLTTKGIEFKEIAVDGDRAARQAMSERSANRTSVPQIFIDGHHVGGCDDLHALDRQGKLDAMLHGEAG